MVTLASLVWLLFVFLLLIVLVSGFQKGRLGDSNDDASVIGAVLVIILLTIFPSYAVAVAITKDLYGFVPQVDFSYWISFFISDNLIGTPDKIRFLVLQGFLAVGFLSIASMLFIKPFKFRYSYASNYGIPSKIFSIGSVIQLISLIASILGIISFYLDYIK